VLGNTSHYILIIAAALGSVIGNSLFRLGLAKTGIESLSLGYLVKNLFSIIFQPIVFVGFIVFAISTVIWMRVLSLEPLNKSYPILMGFVILFLVVSSIIFLNEPLSWVKISGMVIIVLGTFLAFM